MAISPNSQVPEVLAQLEISSFVSRSRQTYRGSLKGIQATHAKLGYQRVATMYDETDGSSPQIGTTALQEAFTAIGVEVLTTEVFRSGDTDFSTQLTQIKALDPDAIFVSALPPEKPGILIQAHELGISAPFIVSSLTGVEVEAAGVAAEGAITFIGWLPTDDTPGNQAFVQNYSATYGMDSKRLCFGVVCLYLYFSRSN